MQSRLDKQQKLYYKNKVSDIITSYERQKQEEEKQKALIKKQIMLSIINNRNKSQNQSQKEKSEMSKEEGTIKTYPSEEPINNTFRDNKVSVKSNLFNQPQPSLDIHFESQERSQAQQLEEITFNAKKRNKSLQEELTFKESYLNLLRERRQKDQEEPNQIFDGYGSNKLPSDLHQPVQKSTYKSSHSSQEQEHNPSDEEAKPSKNSMLQKYSYFKESIPQPKSEYNQYNHSKYQPEDYDKKYQYEDEEEDDEDEEVQEQEYDDPEVEEERERQRQREREREKKEPEEPKGVFLTMEESESMVAEQQQPKNYAYEIKLDKAADPQDLEQLKKQRIREIQRKRQERIEQFRRNQSQKKVEMPKGKNSYSKKIEKDQNNESDPMPPRSATIERKNNPSTAVTHKNQSAKPDRQNYPKTIVPIESHQSQYSIKPTSSKHLQPDPQPRPPSYKQMRPPMANNDDREKPLSPFRTPKSIISQNVRGKSNGKNTNIFTIQNQPQREKSSNKYSQPKIQPKDRKNSFTRQSNKKQMINAITYVIFPGELNRKQRERLIDIIEASQYEFFIFLFKQYSRKMIKGIYIFDSSQTYLRKIYGEKSPQEITAQMVQQFYKYDNGSREFKKLDGCRSFSYSINAIDLRK